MGPQGDAAVNTTGVALTVNGTATGPFSTLPKTNLRTTDVTLSGPALKPWTVEVTSSQLDPAAVGDVLLLLRYAVA